MPTDFCRVCDKQTDHPTHHHHLVTDIRIIAGTTYVGNTPYPNVVLAQRHAHEWQSHVLPVRDSERGGSSSPVELAERVEDRRVAQQAARDAADFPGLMLVFEQEWILGEAAHVTKLPVRVAKEAWWHVPVTPELAKAAERFARVVARCVRIVDHDQLPSGPVGCRSCARKDPKRGLTGHFEPVSSRYEKKGLCDQCGRFAGANKGRFPPIEFCDVLARQGKHAAGRWLARQKEKVTA